MKKIITLMFAAALAAGAYADEFVSPGKGTVYTLEDLSKIETCGVRKVEGAWVLDSTFTISDGDVLRLQNNEVVKFTNKLQVRVNGTLDCAPADTVLITRDSEESTPKGFRMYSDNAKAILKNARFEYVGFTFGGDKAQLTAENCTFYKYNGTLSSGGALNFTASCTGNLVDRCNFLESASAAISNGANTPIGIKITNCYFGANNYKNSNRPQINLTTYGTEDVEISDNTIIGGHYTKVGGIAVSNMLGMAFSNKVVLKNNVVKENRYGINVTGPVNAYIIDNDIVDNTYETNANNGGSGISIYDSAGKGAAYIKGNLIQNNLWGVTIIGSPEVNAGKVEDQNAADYNPGENVFKNNGNNNVLYDLYNNGPKTVYAQGNLWNVEVQDSVSIEKVVWHKVDNETLGLVIFMPAGKTEQTSVTEVKTAAPVESVRYFDAMGRESAVPFEGINIVVARHTDGTITTTKQLR